MTIQQSSSRHGAGYLFCLGRRRAVRSRVPLAADLLALRSRAPLRPGARPWCAAVTSSLPVGAWRSCVPPRHQQQRPRAGARRWSQSRQSTSPRCPALTVSEC